VSRNLANFSSSVSVCLATFNGEKFIQEQVNSILAQLGDADELIISDNGSTDATLDCSVEDRMLPKEGRGG
jgi:glycosyltransferase involved in cell wall biosynthesis